MVAAFPDEESCHLYLASQRWDTGEIICPHEGCGHNQCYVFKDGIRYKCKKCAIMFTAKTNTFMEGSKLPTIKWMMAMHLVMHKKGISSVQLSRDLGVTQKTAWFMLQRVRWALGHDDDGEKLEGIIEIDESFVGGKNKNRHHDKKYKYTKKSRNYPDKTPVFGMLERGGKLKAMVVDTIAKKNLKPLIYKNIHTGSTIYSDAYQGYRDLANDFHTGMVEHHKGNYANGYVYTNGIENFWSHMKRGIIGVYHQVSRKHLDKYVQEFVFKYNHRTLDMQGQMNQIISNMECRLKYKDLIR